MVLGLVIPVVMPFDSMLRSLALTDLVYEYDLVEFKRPTRHISETSLTS